jgi:phenylacetate-coenzyme A ligase PaaK-like adenylate-forming protein
MNCEWPDKIFSVTSAEFQSLALEIFHFQYQNNRIYREFAEALKIRPSSVNTLENIPFLPISFFKSDEIKTGEFSPEMIFESSGTTGSIRSRHLVKDKAIYIKSFIAAFEKNFGAINEYCIIGLLPSYQERNESSLVFMVNELIKRSKHPHSGFFLNEFEKLKDVLTELENIKQKTILIGVTFALLDLAEKYPMPLRNTVIMETGGMKGRRVEMTRTEVHEILKKAFGKNEIHSEYGMTELLSQAYSKGSGLFHSPPWMKVLVRDEEDPMNVQSLVGSSESVVQSQEPVSQLTTPDSRLSTISGAINIIDLANIYSCSFIATDDAGKLYADGSFEVLGRMDGSDLRGCSLMSL